MPLQEHEAFFQQALSAKDFNKLQSLLDEWVTSGGSPNAGFMSDAIHEAVRCRDVDLTKVLVQGGCIIDFVAMRSILKYTNDTNDLSLLQAVLDAGFDVNTCLSGHQGDALLIALLYRKQPPVEMLLSYGADPNRNRRFGSESAIELAVKTATPDVVELLLQHGATMENRAALHYAASGDRTDICEILLRHGQDVNAIPDDEEIPEASPYSVAYQTKGWGTALHEAAKKGNGEMIRFLLRNGADATLKDNLGRLARDIAADSHNDEVVNILSDNSFSRTD